MLAVTNYINADGIKRLQCLPQENCRWYPDQPRISRRYQTIKRKGRETFAQWPQAVVCFKKTKRSRERPPATEVGRGRGWLKKNGGGIWRAKGPDYWAQRPRITGITPRIRNRAPGRQSATVDLYRSLLLYRREINPFHKESLSGFIFRFIRFNINPMRARGELFVFPRSTGKFANYYNDLVSHPQKLLRQYSDDVRLRLATFYVFFLLFLF